MATKDYAAIARAKIRKPSDSKRKPRILVYGRNKKGKTRFCSTAPGVLIIDPESGTDHETKIDPSVWPVDNWDDMTDVYNFLRTRAPNPHTKEPIQWIALDGITRIHNMALRWVMNQEEERNLDRKPGQVDKRDWGRANEMVKGMLANFHTIRDVGIIITAQERMREVEAMSEQDDDAEQAAFIFVPDLPNGARSQVNSIVDVIGRIYTVRGEFTKRVRDKDGNVSTVDYQVQRRLWIGPHESYDTGYRSEWTLPDFVREPTVPRLITVMREGIKGK
jgi:hypothetical protein